MKKLLLVVVLLFVASARGEDLITTTLLNNVMPVTQFKSGGTKLALLDSIVQIGSHGGKSILDLQAGFSGNTKPVAGEVSSANLIGGAFLKLNSLVGDVANFPVQWEFLRSLEYGPAYTHDFREKKDYLSFQVGLSFELKPK